ncbi:ATP-dependent zinc metalloprotease YME1L1-like [Acanthaster planci]|uniref:ATP-dependent zinc metalloprotease YME1L1-like n=1 Tax=Acanthaster planci TaxID=133434 RepID=A0A8B7ZKJ9_ACAPL|nr:ATP-dependent zinc metalloprotease YME1L1-like [Acanthaster planci]
MFSVSGVSAQQLLGPLPHLAAVLNSVKATSRDPTAAAWAIKHSRQKHRQGSGSQVRASDADLLESLQNVALNIEEVGAAHLPEGWADSLLAKIPLRQNGDGTWKESHISAQSFFENKNGFPERLLRLRPSSASFKDRHPLLVDYRLGTNGTLQGFYQSRGFKTKRAGTAKKLRSSSVEEEPPKGMLSSAFQRVTTREPTKLSDKLESALAANESRISDGDSFKIGYVEGFLKGKEEPKRSDRLKTWTTILVIGVLIYLYFKMVSVFARVSIMGPSNVDSMNVKDVSFDDVRGIDEAKNELQDIVSYLMDPEKYTKLGGRLPKGVMLVGSPGTGKTLLARAVAGEANVPFFYASGSDFDNMFVGSGAKRVRDVFGEAKANAPCVVFIDELDSVGGKRVDSPLHPYARQTINQLLAEMDGFKQNEGIVVLAATNFPESLDPALTRPGRFDMKVMVPKPDVKGRTDILMLYLSKVTMSNEVDLDVLARGTVGFTGADIENLVNQAALQAARLGKAAIDMKDLEYAKDKILMGPERKSAQIDEHNRKITAYHEGGHALVAYYTKGAKNINKATIMPRGPTLGHVSLLPDKDQWNETKSQLLAQMDVCMGGRVAEEIVFGGDNITTGASSDFEQATAIARLMVTKFGMSEKLGVMTYSNADEMSMGTGQKPSPETQSLIESEIRVLLKDSYERAKSILKTHSKEHRQLAEALLRYETLTAEEIGDLLQGK